MELDEAKKRFVQVWGTVGVDWGISRTMAQLHALLLSTSEALTTEEVMEQLQISRGNANMNLRELVSWGLVYRESRLGDRKDYYFAEKDIWEVARRIVTQRKQRELDPMVKLIKDLKSELPEGDPHSREVDEFRELLDGIEVLADRSGLLLDLVLKVDQSTFFKPVLRLLKGK